MEIVGRGRHRDVVIDRLLDVPEGIPLEVELDTSKVVESIGELYDLAVIRAPLQPVEVFSVDLLSERPVLDPYLLCQRLHDVGDPVSEVVADDLRRQDIGILQNIVQQGACQQVGVDDVELAEKDPCDTGRMPEVGGPVIPLLELMDVRGHFPCRKYPVEFDGVKLVPEQLGQLALREKGLVISWCWIDHRCLIR